MSWLYVLETADGSFYCGITEDVERRLRLHNSGDGAKYTRSRRPCVLRAAWKRDPSSVRRDEYAFKKLTRKEKEAYLAAHPSEL